MKLSLDINTDFEVTTLTDLPKLKIVMENLNMKINKSEIARHMDVDRRGSSASRRPRLRRHPRKAKPFNTKYCINREQQ
ncbi:hypothetical protein [Staphylococcus aureus]|uniref:hypothetical protein n=1 Tax=Staphylococcus aureus TaxID=1280 RepID=UPI001F25EAD3|nr:hypothetical protein [Staphylococcus aureus]